MEVETLTPATQLNVHFRLSAIKLTQSVNSDLDPHAYSVSSALMSIF